MPQSLQRKSPRVLWTIAGFDPSSGAGVTADLMTFAAHGAFGCSAISALTAQNTQGVHATQPVQADLFRESLRRLAEDLPPVGVKIGMLGGGGAAAIVADMLRALRKDEQSRPVVVLDPVLRSSSGRDLYPAADLGVLHTELLPLVDWITPNHAELAVLSNQPVKTLDQAEAAGRALMQHHPALGVVVTGGDLEGQPTDLLLATGADSRLFHGERVETTSTHGTGCAFSSSFLVQCAAGRAPEEAMSRAKAFVEGALRHAPGLGSGRGPMSLLWPLLERTGPETS